MKVDVWEKVGCNPVLPKRVGKWDAHSVRELSPVIDEDTGVISSLKDGRVMAFYCGNKSRDEGFSIGLALSPDNGFTWSERLADPVVKPKPASWYRRSVGQPWTLRLNDGYLMMMATGVEDDTRSLGVFTSYDGLAWKDCGAKLSLDQFHYDDDHGLGSLGVPCVIKRSTGDFFVVFEGRKKGEANHWRVFGASSSDFVGSWKPYNGGYPFFLESGDGWESIGVANPKLVEEYAGQFLLAYNGMGSDSRWRVGFARTSDFVRWDRHLDNPVMSPSFDWEAIGVETSFLAKGDEAYQKFYYQGFDKNGCSQVGLALCRQMAATSDKVSFRHRVKGLFKWSQKKVTQRDIVLGLQKLGLKRNSIVLVHSSLSRFGYVLGGANTVIEALIEVVGVNGTLLMPAFTNIVDVDATFDVRTKPCDKSMGIIPETFRRRKDTLRSLHPSHSLTAVGAKSKGMVADHDLSVTPFGDKTPFSRLVQWGGFILFLGVDLTYNTSVHTFEDSVDSFPYKTYYDEVFPIRVLDHDGVERVVRTTRFNPAVSKFRDVTKIEKFLLKAQVLRKGMIGDSLVRLMKAQDLMDTLTGMFEQGITVYTKK